MNETLIQKYRTQPPDSHKMIEVTVAADGSRVLISPDIIGEVRDMSQKPGRHLEKWGRTLLKHKSKRIFWNVLEDFETVRQMLGCVSSVKVNRGSATTNDDAAG